VFIRVTRSKERRQKMAIATGYIINIEELHKGLADGISEAAATGTTLLVSYSQPAPRRDILNLFSKARQLSSDAFFWERAEDDLRQASAGAVATFQGKSSTRFAQVEKDWREMLTTAHILRHDIGDTWGVGPALVGGFAFDTDGNSPKWQSFGDGRLVLPAVQYVSRADGSYITLNAIVSGTHDATAEAEKLAELAVELLNADAPQFKPTSGEPTLHDIKPAADWQAIVQHAVDDIRAGKFEKVVLAREVAAHAQQPIDVAAALDRLRKNYPTATIFAVAQGESCFIGATPERLVRLLEGEVRTIALAGTARRGKTPDEDREIGVALLNDPKNRQEHEIVVKMLRAALEKVGSHVWAEKEPHLLKLPNVQHLYTPVLGRLACGSGASVLSLVAALHPTPALGGFPRETALSWLRQHEDLERGWYAAPVGWLDSRGEGEFVVAIRSALVNGADATLYAGCGIVGESDPAAEYAETILKLRPMLTALGLVS
jgi:isochorismate synthase